jgi:Ca-activated chloride channel homolog
MRSLLVVAVLCTVVHGQTFTSTVDQVAVPVTIQTEPNEAVVDLRPDDFRVFDDGRSVPIVAFGRIRQSLDVLLLLDTSRSMMRSLSEVRSAASAVIAQLAPDDSFQVGTFSSTLRLSPPFSADDGQLAAHLPLAPGANMTMLYDALMEGCAVFTGEMNRRAIFVVSDGVDTASAASARSVMRRAAETNVAIYAVGIDSHYVEGGKPIARSPDRILREIAEDTGGVYVNAGGNRDFSRLFASTIEELRRQYILGFTPAHADGRLHPLVVTIRRPNIRIRARKHYFAPVS